MKTLFVYCSEDETINLLCSESAEKMKNTNSFSLMNDEEKTVFSRYFGINRVKRSSSTCRLNIDINEFDKIIIACDEHLGEVPPEVSAFINKYDLRYKDIECIVFGCGRNLRRAEALLRNSISLSGGTVNSIVSVAARTLKNEEEDVIFSLRHRFAV